MEDKGSGVDVVTVWKLDDPATLRMELEQREAVKRAKEEREAKLRVPPEEMFRSMTDQYSVFDANGMPTHDAKGELLSKKHQKKLEKDMEKQRVVYQKYLASRK